MKTSLGIWALGPMVTRFVPGGYKPQRLGETTAARVREAVEGLGDLIDGYEFHYPQELSEDNLDEVRSALDGHDVYCVASGMHLDSRFGRGGLVSPDAATRAEALRETLDAIDFAGRARVPTSSSGRGSRATTTRFRRPYARVVAWLLEGIGRPPSAAGNTGSRSSSSTRTRSPR